MATGKRGLAHISEVIREVFEQLQLTERPPMPPITPVYIGVDPGSSGAIAAIGGTLYPSPRFCKLTCTERDAADFMQMLVSFGGDNCHAIIERVHSMPKQGVASSFKFGQSYGFLRGLLIALHISFEEVTPQKWQQVMGCRSKGDKNVTKAKAQQLFPGVNVTHAIADALLLAEYLRRTSLTSLDATSTGAAQ